MSDQLVSEAATHTTLDQHNRRTSMPSRDSNPRSLHSSGRRPRSSIARPPESAKFTFSQEKYNSSDSQNNSSTAQNCLLALSFYDKMRYDTIFMYCSLVSTRWQWTLHCIQKARAVVYIRRNNTDLTHTHTHKESKTYNK
jgi:hypothetical protein